MRKLLLIQSESLRILSVVIVERYICEKVEFWCKSGGLHDCTGLHD